MVGVWGRSRWFWVQSASPKGLESQKTLIRGKGRPCRSREVGRLGRSECLVMACTGPLPD